MTNSAIAAFDMIILTTSGGTLGVLYQCCLTVYVRNNTAGSPWEAIAIAICRKL
ncbi:hypothetical protein [Mesorhizobium carmichaelinearum]|uniref:hypothetical protein n=1 Tax=Mesorhizobium carmichaelinearum TaxID=1208188 RepID=UPI0015CB5BAB|nr:hypothetical protein [Mesorhizobium carmichaelinearum]